VVVELADGPAFLMGEGFERLDRPQDREGDSADGVVADRPVPARLGLVVDDDRSRFLVDGEDLGPQANLPVQVGEEGVRQAIHPAGNLLHIHVRLAEVLPEDLDDRVVHVGLEEVHHGVVLDGALAPTLLPKELVERELVVAPDDLVPGRLAFVLDHGPQLSDGRLPELVGRAPSFVVGQVEGQAGRLGVRGFDRHPLAVEIDEALGIAHHERPQGQVEEPAVLEGQIVGARDAHAPGFGIQAWSEAAQRVDAATNPILGLEHDDPMALALELVRGHQPGETGPDDDHEVRYAGPAAQSRTRDCQRRRRGWRRQVRGRLRRGIREVLR
jgi:hypothetical protein